MSERKTGSGERQDAEQPEAAQQNEPQGPTLKFPELPERRSLMGGVMFRKKLARARAFQKERSGESEEAPAHKLFVKLSSTKFLQNRKDFFLEDSFMSLEHYEIIFHDIK